MNQVNQIFCTSFIVMLFFTDYFAKIFYFLFFHIRWEKLQNLLHNVTIKNFSWQIIICIFILSFVADKICILESCSLSLVTQNRANAGDIRSNNFVTRRSITINSIFHQGFNTLLMCQKKHYSLQQVCFNWEIAIVLINIVTDCLNATLILYKKRQFCNIIKNDIF